ncbi:MAG: hypothetical protein HOK98_02280 [Rhodospirillaceae bacterium]|jgi:hypothetical protein|nr:hypothetical protein [Rhodospirillaceae bacterium]MBT6405755.1 hypothetical protein [Rhodospirillaceae bacterium]MBT6534983.1 hypothetical protein [Rhodospirillaceae bacterium]MBT7361359.1 hypothetical protein [Rhodospirillaceae bacterium]
MLKKRREILIVAFIAAIVVIAGRYFAAENANTVTVEASDTPFSTINQRAEPEERSGDAIVIPLNGAGPSTPVRVGSNQCLQWWGETPDAYRVEVAGINGDDWQPNEAFLAKKQAGNPKYNFPAWYRFTAAGNGATQISYQLLRGLCQ